MNRLHIVATHYRLPEERLRDFLKWNGALFSLLPTAWASAPVLIVADRPYENLPPWAEVLVYPAPLPVFNLCKTSNFGIRTAIDRGAEVIVKTDIDCILGADFLEAAAFLEPNRAACARYRLAKSPEELGAAGLSPLIGTIGIWREDWEKVHGYRETLEGYGVDDSDIRNRARQAGIQVPLNGGHIWHIEHAEKWNAANGINPKNHRANRERLREAWASDSWGRPDAAV